MPFNSPADPAKQPKQPKQPKQRTWFQTTEGDFSAVANTKFIQAMSDERDQFRADLRNVRESVGTIDHMFSAEMPSWTGNHGIGDFHYPMSRIRDESACCWCVDWWDGLRRARKDSFVADKYALPRFGVGIVRATGAWEVLAGGVLVTLPSNWTAAQLEENKAIARLICGEAKAQLAEALTDTEKAELRGAVSGLRAGLKMATVAPGCTPDVADYPSGGALLMLNNWARERPRACKDTLPPNFFALLCEPDEQPLLTFPVLREVHAHYHGDYGRTEEFFEVYGDMLVGLEEGETIAVEMENRAVPIAERLATLQASYKWCTANENYWRRQASMQQQQQPRKKRSKRAQVEREKWDRAARARRLGEEGRKAIVEGQSVEV